MAFNLLLANLRTGACKKLRSGITEFFSNNAATGMHYTLGPPLCPQNYKLTGRMDPHVAGGGKVWIPAQRSSTAIRFSSILRKYNNQIFCNSSHQQAEAANYL